MTTEAEVVALEAENAKLLALLGAVTADREDLRRIAWGSVDAPGIIGRLHKEVETALDRIKVLERHLQQEVDAHRATLEFDQEWLRGAIAGARAKAIKEAYQLALNAGQNRLALRISGLDNKP